MNVRPWRWFAATLGGIVIALALALGAMRLVLSRAPQYSAQISDWIQAQTELRLEFARLDARLRWFGPEIVLHQARVLDRDGVQSVFTTRAGTIGLDLLALFRSGELVAGRIEFLEPKLSVERLADGRFRIVGLRARSPDVPPFDLDRLPAGRVEIRAATVEYRDHATGRGPWIVNDLDLSLRRDAERLEAHGTARLPASLGRTLEFEARLEGALGRPREWAGRLEARVGQARLAGLAQLLPDSAVRTRRGVGDLRAVLALAPGRIERVRLDFDLRDLRFEPPARTAVPIETVVISAPRRPPGGNTLALAVVDRKFVQRPAAPLPKTVEYAALRGTLRYRDDGTQRSLIAEPLTIEARGAPPLNMQAGFTLQGDPRTRFELTARASQVDLAALWPLVQLSTARRLQPWLGLAPRGQIRALDLTLLRERAGSQPRFTVTADVAGLAAAPVGRFPGLQGLSARINGNEREGSASIVARDAAFEWPRLFRSPIDVQRVTAQARWRRAGAAWIFAGDDLTVEHADVSAAGSFALTLEPGTPSPVLELHVTVERADAAVLRKVLPVGRLRPTTLAWLENADFSGQAHNGRLDYRGPVRRFPFRAGEGEFRASADVRDGRVNYFDGFTPLHVDTAHLEFHNASLRVNSTAARLGALVVEKGEYFVADYAAPVIQVNGVARGDLVHALAYLQESPLGPRLGRLFMQLRGQGPARYAVALNLPSQRPSDRDYSVRVDLQSNSVSVPALRAPLQRLAGRLEIHNQSARGEGIRGVYLDGPVEFAVQPETPAPGADIAVSVRAHGRAAGPRLAPYLGLPETISASGTLDYEMSARLERFGLAGPWVSTVNLDSDLTGLAIDAPKPFAKVAMEARPTHVQIRLPTEQRSEAQIESGAARAALAFAPRGERWQLERGQARFDAGPVHLPDSPGLEVLGDWPDIDLTEWLSLATPSSKASGQQLRDWLGPIDVQVERLRLLGFDFADVAARVETSAQGWRIDVSGPQVAGRMVVPFDTDAREPILMNLSRLALTAAAAEPSGSRRAADPRRFPAVLARIDDFQWQSRRFGRLDADLRRIDDGVRLTRLKTEGEAFTIEGDGSWRAAAQGGSQTQLSLRFESTDLAASSLALGYRATVEAQRALAVADLNWPGPPSIDALRTMGGRINLELDTGQLRSVKPGAGRMLGLLSVIELPRRLSLDFRDITDEGFAFDTVRGDFTLRDGSAHTDNLLLKGAAVDIGVVGRTGLVAEDYDQTLVVSGNPGGPLAVASTLAGGPVLGAGVLVLSQLFKGQLQGLTRVYYRVTGPWAEPVVERVSAPADASLVSGQPAPGGGG